MRWPADHPAVTDPALSPWARDVERLCPDAEVIRVLRHLPGRRVTTLVDTGEDGLAVLKLFATSRARGGHQRLAALAESSAGSVVPRPLGHRKGHLALVEFVPGTPLDRLDGEAFVSAVEQAGVALGRLHDSGVELNKAWGVREELDQLRRTAGPATRTAVERAIAALAPRADGRRVPSHRDCYPAQAVWTGDVVRFVDLDDSAMAPPALDVGNFVAHLDLDAVLARRSPSVTLAATNAFVAGYGSEPPDADSWRHLALARLAALAETRHRSPERARLLCGALENMAPVQAGRGRLA